MNMFVKIPPDSYRYNDELKAILDGAQSRHFTDEEYKRYLELFPEEQARVDAARDLMGHEEMVVKRTVLEIMQLYPYQEMHLRAPEKCIRDVTYISIYSTHSMLVKDVQWFKDKLLYWFRTILQAFYFPPADADKSAKNKHPEITELAAEMPEHVRSIYDCYARLRHNYKLVLKPESWELLDEHLQAALDVLTIHH